MPVRVDQAGQHRPAAHVDDLGIAAQLQFLAAQHAQHLAVFADQQAVKAGNLSGCVGVDPIDVCIQRVGGGGAGQEQRDAKGEGGKGLCHGANA